MLWHSRAYALRIVAIGVAVIVIVAVVALLGVVLWRVLGTYIDPKTAAERKDLVQSFAVVVAGIVGSLSALAAVGNLYVSRRNLELQWQLEHDRGAREEQIQALRAQDEALPEYIERIIGMLGDSERPLSRSQEGDEVRTLARVRTVTVLAWLQDGRRKAQIVQFLYESGLIDKHPAIVDLTGVDLTGVELREANLSGAILSKAVGLTDEQIAATESLEGATMPNGQKYEDWFKDKKAQGKDWKNK